MTEPAILADVADGRFVRVRVVNLTATEAVCESIAAGLTDAPADLDVSALAARIRAAVPFGVELANTTPEALAATIHRTPSAGERIGSFTTSDIDRLTANWHQLGWRIIPERPLSAALNVALDEVLTDRVSKGDRPPTLRFWRWTVPAVIVGRSQSVANEVDATAAAAMGVRVVRRISGGGAMFVQPEGAITYSLIVPESAVAGLTIRQSYEVCDAWVIRALRELGIDAHHVPINDIACADGKIGGAAQARRSGVVLHHTTMAYDMDPDEMASVLRVGRAKVKERSVGSAAKRVSPLARQTRLSRLVVVERLMEAFRNQYGGELDEVSDSEMDTAMRLVETKYGTEAWTREFDY